MFKVIAIMFAGIACGYLLCNVPFTQKLGTATYPVILLLLFLLGISTGANQTIISQSGSIIFQAFVMAMLGVAGSIAGAVLVGKLIFKRRKP